MAKMSVPDLEGYMDETLLLPGKYSVEVTDAKARPTKKGKSQIILSLRVNDGPEQDKDFTTVELVDFILTSFEDMSTKGIQINMKKLANVLKAFNIRVEDGEFDEQDFIGKEAQVRIVEGEDQDGQPKEEIKSYAPLVDEDDD